MADETAPILAVPEETSLIIKPYLDRLASAQNKKDAERKNLKESKKRIKEGERFVRDSMQSYWQIGLFLKTKFPDVFFESELASLPQNELKALLKRARNWLWKKEIFYCSGFLASVSSVIGSIKIGTMQPNDTLTAIFVIIFFMLGLVGLVAFPIFTTLVTKILLNRASKRTFRTLEPVIKNAQ